MGRSTAMYLSTDPTAVRTLPAMIGAASPPSRTRYDASIVPGRYVIWYINATKLILKDCVAVDSGKKKREEESEIGAKVVQSMALAAVVTAKMARINQRYPYDR